MLFFADDAIFFKNYLFVMKVRRKSYKDINNIYNWFIITV